MKQKQVEISRKKVSFFIKSYPLFDLLFSKGSKENPFKRIRTLQLSIIGLSTCIFLSSTMSLERKKHKLKTIQTNRLYLLQDISNAWRPFLRRTAQTHIFSRKQNLHLLNFEKIYAEYHHPFHITFWNISKSQMIFKCLQAVIDKIDDATKHFQIDYSYPASEELSDQNRP